MGTVRPAALDALDRTFRSKPLLFVAGAWMAGIGSADGWHAPWWLAVSLGLALGIAALLSRRRWPMLTLLLLGIACLGLAAARVALTPAGGDISRWDERQVGISAIVATDPVNRCDRWRCFVDCAAVLVSGQRHPARGRLYVTTSQDLSQLEPGDRVLVYGIPEQPGPPRNPGGFSLELWLARRGAFATLAVLPGDLVPLGAPAAGWRAWPARLRHRIAAANRRAMADRVAADLVNSMLFGDIDPQDARGQGERAEQFRRAGVSHVLVVSGAQVALLFGLLSGWRRWALRHGRADRWYGRWLRGTGRFSFRQALAGGLIFLLVYVPLVGLQPSILRPALAVTIYFIGRLLDREIDPENTLAAAALILLIANPLTLYDLSFQISFAAVWGILRWTAPLASLLCGRWHRAEEGRPDELGVFITTTGGVKTLATIQAMTLAAQLATAPLVARQFQTLSLIAPISNLPAVLLTTALLPIGLFTSVLSTVLPAFPHVSWLTQQLARLLAALVGWFARAGSATILVSPPGWTEVALVGGFLISASAPWALQRPAWSAALAAVAAAVFVVSLLRPAFSVRVPTITFIDVGQGDGCLIRLPGGANLLLDGGGSPRAPCGRPDCSDAAVGQLAGSLRGDCHDVGRDVLAPLLRYERIRRIDLLILSHPHDDHLWGLDALLDPREGFDVRAVLDVQPSFVSRAYREWSELLRRRGLRPIVARRGVELAIGPARLAVLHPSDPFFDHTPYDSANGAIVNNDSIVCRLDVGGTHVLFAGDAQNEAELAMAGADVRADVLKVGHHGSAYSTSDAWLDRVRPRIAVISCGRHNAFGHPSPDTVARLLRHGVQVYRTDQDGAVTLRLGAKGWSASTQNQSAPMREEVSLSPHLPKAVNPPVPRP